MKRKIAIIADGWRRHITYVWIRGCRNYIKEHELDIEISVFHSFGNFSRDEKFNAGMKNSMQENTISSICRICHSLMVLFWKLRIC